MSFQLINPATEEIFAEIPLHGPRDVESLLSRSDAAFEKWREMSFAERGACFEAMGIYLKRNADSLARQITDEMGKILPESKAEIEKCAACCLHYASAAEGLLENRDIIRSGFKKSYVAFEPLGVILGILPWNFPFWQFFRFAVPTLMAGNTIIFKHSPNTVGSAQTIENLFREFGFPEDVVRLLIVDVPIVNSLIADRRVRGVSLTGSTRAGRAVAAQAGQFLKPSVLELGGSDPYVVLDDADLKATCDTLVQARFLNCGQSCISAKRYIVTQKNASVVEGLLSQKISTLTIGPGTEAVSMGPMARKDLRDQLSEQVQQGLKQGLKAAVGGQAPPRRGFYYQPTLLTEARPGTVAFEEELFGPVATLSVAQDEVQALDWANQTRYGLGAAVFSSDLQRAEALARKHLRAGSVFVNGFVRSDIELPFGGVADSGLGRELSQEGIRSFVNVKTICIC